MALDGTSMGTEIFNALDSAGYIANDPGQAEAMWQEISKAIIAHFEANSVVPSGIAVSVDPNTGAGSTTGPGSIT